MALTVLTDYESGVNLDAATAANTGSASVVVTGGSMAISTAFAYAGTRSLKCISTSTSGGVYALYNITAATALYTEMFVYITASPSGELGLFYWGGPATRQLGTTVSSTRQLIIRDGQSAGGQVLWTSTAMPANTWIRTALFATQSATVGTVRAAWSATAPYTAWAQDSGLLTAKNTGTGGAGYSYLRIGAKTSTDVLTWDALYQDSLGYQAGGTDFPATAAPVLDTTPTQSSKVFIDLSGTTYAVGPVTYAAVPSTGVVPGTGGLSVPAPTVNTDYTVTATDQGNGLTASGTVTVLPLAGGGMETVVWNGAAWV